MSGAGAPAFAAGQSVADALRRLRRALAQAGVETAALDARCLVEAATGRDRATVVTAGERPLGDAAAVILAGYAARRLAGEPVARILGEREFWGLPFALTLATLVPRPETETVVEHVLAHVDATLGRAHTWRILDLGTGSGCILVALLSELPNAFGLGIDRSPEAAATAAGNARRNGIGRRAAFVASDWGTSLDERFDVIVSNPPYIADGEIAHLSREVWQHDPRLALAGGPDGLAAYRTILTDVPRLLGPDGLIVVEAGAGQAGAIRALMGGAGLAYAGTRTDLGGIERSLAAGRPATASEEA